jgi:hypothetical protein
MSRSASKTSPATGMPPTNSPSSPTRKAAPPASVAPGAVHVYGYSVAAIAEHQGVTDDAIRRRRLRAHRKIGKADDERFTPAVDGPLTKRQADVQSVLVVLNVWLWSTVQVALL